MMLVCVVFWQQSVNGRAGRVDRNNGNQTDQKKDQVVGADTSCVSASPLSWSVICIICKVSKEITWQEREGERHFFTAIICMEKGCNFSFHPFLLLMWILRISCGECFLFHVAELGVSLWHLCPSHVSHVYPSCFCHGVFDMIPGRGSSILSFLLHFFLETQLTESSTWLCFVCLVLLLCSLVSLCPNKCFVIFLLSSSRPSEWLNSFEIENSPSKFVSHIHVSNVTRLSMSSFFFVLFFPDVKSVLRQLFYRYPFCLQSVPFLCFISAWLDSSLSLLTRRDSFCLFALLFNSVQVRLKVYFSFIFFLCRSTGWQDITDSSVNSIQSTKSYTQNIFLWNSSTPSRLRF